MHNDLESGFAGTIAQWIGISIGCFFLSIIPIIGLPNAICIKQRWLTKNTKYVGMNMEFIGTSGDLLFQMIKWVFYFIITLTFYGLAIPVKYRQWLVNNTVFAPI